MEALAHYRFGSYLKVKFAGPEREPGIHKRMGDFIREHNLSKIADVSPSVWGDAKMGLYTEASIFLLPSYFENFPLVLLEAAAAGLAIVTTPVGAVPEFFKDGESALFIEPKSSNQIAEAINTLTTDRKKRLQLAKGARKVFESRLARINIMNSLNSVYASVLERSGK